MGYWALATITIEHEFSSWKIGKRYFRNQLLAMMASNLETDCLESKIMSNEAVTVISWRWNKQYNMAFYDLAEEISYKMKAKVMYQFWDENHETHVEYFEDGIKLNDRVNER